MSEFRFDGKVAIVTGAGGGLGKAHAKLLAARGAKVLVNDLGGNVQGKGSDENYAQVTVAEIRAAGGIAEANGDSVGTTVGVNAIVEQALDTWGGIDIVVNNAGVAVGAGPLWNITDEQWETDVNIAAGGTFRMCRAVWKHMWDKNYGRIINTASSCFFGMGSGISYTAGKGAVWSMTRGLYSAANAQGKNICVNGIMPIAGSRMTALLGDEINTKMHNEFPLHAVAPLVALLAHEQSPCNGEMFSVGGGGFARVFLGIASGYRGINKNLSIEEAYAHFSEAMATDEFIVPKDSLEDAEQYNSTVPWNVFRQQIV
jgi:NAD(P)-dependent dehydrogenase (short-subunit alcohol dehydrogenase family)